MSNMNNKHRINSPYRLNTSRRKFLQQLGYGMGLLGTMNASMASSQIIPSIPSTDAVRAAAACFTPSITTRLFASSNAGWDKRRNQLALARMACAGFDVQNPEAASRYYLRFAGTDVQRASDLQNVVTGALSETKLLLGVRGGYGAMRLLPLIDWSSLGAIMREQGSILAGFSDVTAIQCALLAQGSMSSLAAPMLYSEFGKAQPDRSSCQHFVAALTQTQLNIDVNDAALT